MVSRAAFAALLDGLPGLKRWRLDGKGGARLYWEGRSDSEEEEEEEAKKIVKRQRQEGDEEDGDRIARQAMLATMKMQRDEADKAKAIEDAEHGDEWAQLLNMQ